MDLISMIGRTRKSVVSAVVAMSLAALLTVSVGTANAAKVNVEYNINTGDSPSFAFSYIHSATSEMGNSGFYNGGKRLFKLNGPLKTTFDTDTGQSTLRDGPIDLTAEILPDGLSLGFVNTNGGQTGAANAWVFRITALDIIDKDLTKADTGSGTQNGASGTLSYQLLADANGGVINSGTFHFFDAAFSGAPNTLQTNENFETRPIHLWGNNWENGPSIPKPATTNDFIAFGIDLGGTGGNPVTVVPVPMAAWGGLSLMGMMGLLRIKRRFAEAV